MPSRPTATTLFVFLSLLLGACQEGTETTAEGGSEATPEAATEDAALEALPEEATIVGSTLTTTLTAEEAAETPEAAGTWDLHLGEDGRFTVRQGQEIAVEGRYTIEGDRITFADESGPAMCADDPEGIYQWTVSGDDVTMTAVDDTCPGRLAVLMTHPQTKKQ